MTLCRTSPYSYQWYLDDVPVSDATEENWTFNLSSAGHYDGTPFYRIVPGFIIEGGDTGAKSIAVPTIQDELPNKHSNVRGSVAMGKTAEPNSARSIFYINLNDSNADFLDSNYSVFGMVTAGMYVVDAISNDASLPQFHLIRWASSNSYYDHDSQIHQLSVRYRPAVRFASSLTMLFRQILPPHSHYSVFLPVKSGGGPTPRTTMLKKYCGPEFAEFTVQRRVRLWVWGRHKETGSHFP